MKHPLEAPDKVKSSCKEFYVSALKIAGMEYPPAANHPFYFLECYLAN